MPMPYDVQMPPMGGDEYQRLHDFYCNQDYSMAPVPVIAFLLLLDEICGVAGCGNWREYVPMNLASEGSMLGVRPITFSMGMHMYIRREGWLGFHEFHQREGGDDSSSMLGFMKSLYRYMFQTENTRLAELTDPHALTVLAILVCLLAQAKSTLIPLFSSYGRDLGRAIHGEQWERRNEERIFKFGEYSFRLLCHTLIACYGSWLLYDKNWLNPTANLFKNAGFQEMTPAFTWYYLFQGAYHLESLLYLISHSFRIELNSNDSVKKKNHGNIFGKKFLRHLPIFIGWSETVRGDFREMFIHHIVTNLLVFTSGFFRTHRIGAVVMIIHDVSDIFVDLSKLANFVKWKTATTVCVVMMILVWMITRLIALPFVVIRSIIFEHHFVLEDKNWLCKEAYEISLPYCMLFFAILLTALFFLHLYWFGIIVRIAIDAATKKDIHDYSEHKEGESSQQEDPKKCK